MSQSPANMKDSEKRLEHFQSMYDREVQILKAAEHMRDSTPNQAVREQILKTINDGSQRIQYIEEQLSSLKLEKQIEENGGENPTDENRQSIARPPANHSKLDLIKHDTPYLGPKIQLMVSQLAFKLKVENQYKEATEKMNYLYKRSGDNKNGSSTLQQLHESNQKLKLLEEALKEYEGLYAGEDTDDAIVGEANVSDPSQQVPHIRKPLSGVLTLRIHAVKDIDRLVSARPGKNNEPLFVVVKVEDKIRAKTKPSRNDYWTDENFTIDIDRNNEIELTVYQQGEDPIPIAMLWIRIADIVEEMRRKKIESEINASGWVSADKVDHGSGSNIKPDIQSQATAPTSHASQSTRLPQTATVMADSWFALEPGSRRHGSRIHLSMSFAKQQDKPRGMDQGLNRQGAVRQKNVEVQEKQGHKFVTQSYYHIMHCALCADLLKYSGMQCAECRLTCHKKCLSKVVTKCISKANHEVPADEELIKHRIPHHFEFIVNFSANWCCHCGSFLPFGRKSARVAKKCSHCGVTCHPICEHLVPDFCGMPLSSIERIITTIKEAKNKREKQNLRISETESTRSSEQQKHKQSSSISSDSTSPTSPSSRPSSTPTKTDLPIRVPSGPPAAPYPGSGPEAAPDNHQQHAYTHPPLAQGPTIQSQPVLPLQPHQRPPQSPSSMMPDQGAYQQFPTSAGYPPSQQMAGYPPKLQYGRPQYVPVSQQQVRPMYQPAGGLPPHMQQPPAHQMTKQRIGLDHFNFLAVLGKGNFGKVMLAETKTTKQLFAVKVLKKEFIIENDEVESMKSEKRVFLIANKERHPFLTNLHACFQTETRVYFVMEYISGGDLMLHIQRDQFGLRRTQFYAAEICLALKYFHENGVIYRDLKLDNILLTLDGHIKIADYGLCKEDMWYGRSTSTFCGTPEFMAPEILLSKGYGRVVDWWAFGVLLYQMLLQQSPFRGADEDEIYEAVLSDEPLYPIDMPRDSVSILQKLLTREPERRLGYGPADAEAIMSHAFFRNINWDDIYHKRVPPPMIPQISSATDTSNFDTEFTSVTPVLTPVNTILSPKQQEEFRGFSYFSETA